MRIDCHVPITLRIVGVPTDDQLVAVGRALTRAVAARLAESERLLADRHGLDHGPEATDTGSGLLSLAASPESAPKLDDVLAKALREADRNPTPHQPPPHRPAPIVPGDRSQQHETIPHVDALELWRQPHIQEAFRRLAEFMETWERNKTHATGPIKYDAAYWMDRWRFAFISSVNYILEVRPTDRTRDGKSHPAREAMLMNLRAAEAKLLAGLPPGRADTVLAQVAELRRKAGAAWLARVNEAARRFVVMTENEVGFLTEAEHLPDVSIYGLPEYLEHTIPASAFPKLFQQEAGSPGFSPSVATFIAALQREWGGRPVIAENYHDHERALRNDVGVGLYSFDVRLDGLVPVDGNGFYDHDKTVEFFLAAERAGKATGIVWRALYDDSTVIHEVNTNALVRQRRILFAGGRTPMNASPEREGSIHHGPEPFILHVHFDIMPKDLGERYMEYLRGGIDQPLDFDLYQPPRFDPGVRPVRPLKFGFGGRP